MSSLYERERSLAVSDSYIDGLQADLSGITQQNIYQLPILTGLVNHRGDYTRPDVKFVPGYFKNHRDADEPSIDQEIPHTCPDRLTFYPQPGLRLGRENSHNKVFFGRMFSHWVEGGRLPEMAPVAVKTTKSTEELLGELAMFQYLNDLGLPTYRTEGLLLTEEGNRQHLLTRYDPTVATMDTVDWRDYDPDERWSQLSSAVDTLVALHGNMLFHGDFHIRNVGYGETGGFVVVDPEYMSSAAELAEICRTGSNENERERARQKIKQLMSRDFTELVDSAAEAIYKGLPPEQRPSSPAGKFKAFKRHVYMPYKHSVEVSDSPHAELLLEIFDDMLHEHKQRSRK